MENRRKEQNYDMTQFIISVIILALLFLAGSINF